MAEIGIRELRDHLSQYLEQVKAGEEIVVTDRGRAIARLVPVERESTLDRLIREGRVTLPTRDHRTALSDPIDIGTTVSDIVIRDRR